jgi:hypothetical protein
MNADLGERCGHSAVAANRGESLDERMRPLIGGQPACLRINNRSELCIKCRGSR